MADTDKKWTLLHEPETVVTGTKEVMKGGRPHILASFENPTEGRHGAMWIPKDQLKEVSGVLKSPNVKVATGLANKAAGKLGGKLGMYGAIKGAIEGAETLRKLKTGAYDLTPEGTTKLKKGYVES